jgi:hypothetical protein
MCGGLTSEIQLPGAPPSCEISVPRFRVATMTSYLSAALRARRTSTPVIAAGLRLICSHDAPALALR